MGSLIGGLAQAGGAIFGGINSMNAAKSSAAAISAAIQQGLNFGQGVYNTAQQNLSPYVTGGQGALSSLLGFYGLPGGNPGGATAAFNQFTQTPSYQFPLQQGNLALNRQLASTGLIGSGGALKDAIAYNQGYASQGLGGYLSGLSGIAGSGQQAAGTIGQIGSSVLGPLMQGYETQGGAQGAGIIGSANALNQMLSSLLGTPVGGSVGGGGAASATPATSNNILSSLLSGVGGGVSSLFGGSPSSYTGPSAGTLIGSGGSPGTLQGYLGLGSNQYVP